MLLCMRAYFYAHVRVRSYRDRRSSADLLCCACAYLSLLHYLRPLSDREITTLSRLLFALPECDSLCFRQFLLPPPTPLRIFLLQINNNKVGKSLSYSVTVPSTGPLLRLWVAPRLTAYHTPSPGPRPWLQCPLESVTQDHSYSALTPISQLNQNSLSCSVVCEADIKINFLAMGSINFFPHGVRLMQPDLTSAEGLCHVGLPAFMCVIHRSMRFAL